MKRQKAVARLWLAAVLVLGTSASWAQAVDEGRFYIRGDLGATFMPDVTLEQFVVPGNAFNSTSMELKMNTGFGLRVAGGYRVLPWLGVELETGFTANSVDYATLADGRPQSFDGSLLQVPLLANVVVQPKLGKFTPYVGVGAGMSASVLDVSQTIRFDSDLVVAADGASSTAVFAWQVFAGVDYELSEHAALGVGYRLLSVGDSSWSSADSFFYYDPNLEIKAESTFVQMIAVSFRWKF